MKLFICAVAFLAVGIFARYADAAKPAKPVVCSAYRIVEPALAVCSDQTRPFIMTRFAEVSAPGKAEGAVKVLVGWR